MAGGRNNLIALGLAGVICAMVGVSFAAVPLYRVFCEATGYGGTPDISGRAAPGLTQGAQTRQITVRFNANTNPDLPWDFHPDQGGVTLPMGQDQVAYYHARNKGGEAITGVAVYNVTPEKVGKYFHKTACFCFDEQTLKPGQEMEFPLSFWVDPALASDPNTADVTTITLSYTFFRAADDAARTAALVNAGPHVGKLIR
jgi:cytochrome c oxidase assembly protein subunit 11